MDSCGRAERVLDFGYTTSDANRMTFNGQSDRCMPCLINGMFKINVEVLRHLGKALIEICKTLVEDHGCCIDSLCNNIDKYDNDSLNYRKNLVEKFALKLGISSPQNLKWFMAEGVSILISSLVNGHTDGKNDHRDGFTQTIAYYTHLKVALLSKKDQ